MLNTFLILASAITGCISIFDFTSFIVFLIGITSCTIGLKIYVVTAEIKKYQSINERKKNKHDKILLLAKSKLNSTVLISKAFIGLVFSHDEFVLINNVLK